MAVDIAQSKEIDLISSEEGLIVKQRKEKKELQAQIQKIKHGIPKGDKKKKKEATEQIAKLEAELNAKQEKETKEFQSRQASDDTDKVSGDSGAEEPKPANVENGEPEVESQESGVRPGKKVSKAQKRRDKKQTKDKEREQRIKDSESENRLGPRHQEMVKIKALLRERNLAIYEIPADGNCMYNAVNHQLSNRSQESTNEELRKKAAEYMRSNRDDFLPFLTNQDTGDMLTEEEFENYCDKTISKPVWGGQVELRALSEALRVPIEVIQADTQPLVIGEGKDGNPITVVYHRHVFRLGEHYNSVVKIPSDEDEETQDPS